MKDTFFLHKYICVFISLEKGLKLGGKRRETKTDFPIDS